MLNIDLNYIWVYSNLKLNDFENFDFQFQKCEYAMKKYSPGDAGMGFDVPLLLFCVPFRPLETMGDYVPLQNIYYRVVNIIEIANIY